MSRHMASPAKPLYIKPVLDCITKVMMGFNTSSRCALFAGCGLGNSTPSQCFANMLMRKHLRPAFRIMAFLILILIELDFTFLFGLARNGLVFIGSMYGTTTLNTVRSPFKFALFVRIELIKWLRFLTDTTCFSHGGHSTMAYGKVV